MSPLPLVAVLAHDCAPPIRRVPDPKQAVARLDVVVVPDQPLATAAVNAVARAVADRGAPLDCVLVQEPVDRALRVDPALDVGAARVVPVDFPRRRVRKDRRRLDAQPPGPYRTLAWQLAWYDLYDRRAAFMVEHLALSGCGRSALISGMPYPWAVVELERDGWRVGVVYPRCGPEDARTELAYAGKSGEVELPCPGPG